jgi:hypothetical protein
MRFLKLILGITGLGDPNASSPAIQGAGLKPGQPVWGWSGSE